MAVGWVSRSVLELVLEDQLGEEADADEGDEGDGGLLEHEVSLNEVGWWSH